MAQAAAEQAKAATSSFGDVNSVRQQARVASGSLKTFNDFDPTLSLAIALVRGGLDEIASSKTDEEFTRSVLGMCEPPRTAAANAVGSELLMTVAKAKKDPRVADPEDARTLEYLSGLGATLVNISPKCDQVAEALRQEVLQEQAAEAQHQVNVNRALIAAGVIVAAAAAVESARQVRMGLASQPAPVQNNYFIQRAPVPPIDLPSIEQPSEIPPLPTVGAPSIESLP